MTPRLWLREVAAACDRRKDWQKEGKEVMKIYKGEKAREGKFPFNILFSNTETLLPALYSHQPRVEVRRRFTRRPDPLTSYAALLGSRLAAYLLDTNSQDYAPFDSGMEDAVLDYLLPGQGLLRVKFDARIDYGPDGEARSASEEKVCFEHVRWDRWGVGPGQKWNRLDWIFFEHFLTKEEARARFGAVADDLPYEIDPEDKERPEEERKEGVTHVYEVWDKRKREVLFLSEAKQDAFLRRVEDPLGWEGFFPCAEPPRAVKLAGTLEAIPPYRLYESQAEELNNLTRRIKRITGHLKVRGAYDGRLKELQDILKKDDGELVAAENTQQFQDARGLDAYLWLVPIEKIIAVLQQLIPIREQTKQVIYEITGISDIVRGSSRASETLGAQQLKERWVTLRLKRMQKDIQRYARNTLRIALEVAVKKMPPDALRAIVDLDLPSELEKRMALLAGAEVPPLPSFEEVLALLRSDLGRRYRLDIETNSTVELEATQDKQDVSELLIALGQYLNGVSPLVQNGVMPFPVAKSILLQIVRRFRFGEEVEEELEEMQPPEPPEDLEGEKERLVLQRKEAEMGIREKAGEADRRLLEKTVQLDVRGLELDLREERLKHAEALAAERQRLQEEHLKMTMESHEQRVVGAAEKVARKHEERVKGLVSGVAREAGAAKAAGGQFQALVGAVQRLVESQQATLEAVSGHLAATSAQLEALTSARRSPVRVELDPKTGRATRLVPET